MKSLSRLFLAAILLFGCEKGADKKKPAGPDGPPRTPASAIDPATAGTISGTVRFQGTPPAKEPLEITEPSCRQLQDGPVYADKVIVTDGHLENVFVYVKKGLEGYRFDPPREEVVIDQKGCLYHPLVVGVMAGQPLVFQNSDPILHNVHTLPEENEGANLAQPRKGMRNETVYSEPEVMVKTKCDVHPWMRAYIGVVEHPHFHVTGADGRFSFEGLPPGTYVLGAWHETLGEKELEVTLGEKGAESIEFVFPGS